MNESGVQPVEYKILIKPESVEQKTAGGLYLPDQTKDKDQMAQIKGVLIAKGGNAFEDWNGEPQIGDKVYFAKYAGYVIKGEDGEEYRLANDKDVAAIIR
jgi:chaperonin GroES